MIAKAVQRRLDYAADVDLWDQATFDLSSVTIDALEERCRTADFAVFVLTPDDVKIKRETKTAAARDNVVFELGLFAGTLGRQRCFLIHDKEKAIDLPSDLAGITPATFRIQQSGDLDASLGAACSKIEKAMEKLKGRPKLSVEALSAVREVSAFCDRAVGHWWQRVQPDDASALSFVRVEADPATNAVKMGGVAYHLDGMPIADWNSIGVSIDTGDRKLSYIWEGSHPKQPNDSYQGFGWITFDDSPEAFAVGRGIFFNANLAHLDTSRRKSLVFRRCTEQKEMDTMNGKDGKAIAAMVLKKLKSW
jgi:hypothetical protein